MFSVLVLLLTPDAFAQAVPQPRFVLGRVPPLCTAPAADASPRCETELALKTAQEALAALGDCSAHPTAACTATRAELLASVAALNAALPPPATQWGVEIVKDKLNRTEP